MQFEEARWWYERIFNPTASESPLDKQPTDRNWRYIEFRELTLPKLKDILTDTSAIEAYKKDPFNPHAIARLRPSAYQKAIVMHYVDNLLDWGDALFAQDTEESITEATMLYVLAAYILGKRPVKLGKCDTASEDDLTYEQLGPAIDKGSEFLLTLETWSYVANWQLDLGKSAMAAVQNGLSAAAASSEAAVDALASVQAAATQVATRRATASGNGNGTRLRPYATIVAERSAISDLIGRWETERPIERWPGLEHAVQSTLAFCIPANEELLKYWDRVEDRLFKIRHCMNLSGVRRQLALFQPPIDPMLLVRARAAGLGLDEALAASKAPLSPYRFTYLIDKARQSAQTVQSFGAALLSALEKKDVEELTLLRSVHERDLLRMTREVKTQQVREAQFTLQSLVEAKTNVESRIVHLQGLIDEGLTGWEITQQVSRHAATGVRLGESVVHLQAAITYLIPQVGSPFAMKYGGKELGDSGVEFALWTKAMSEVLDAVSGSAGLEATFQRREEEWKHSLTTALRELRQLEQQRLAAEAHVAMAEKDLEIHRTTIDQAAELDEFYRGKFTSLGLYNYLATTLTRLYRQAYNVAQDVAQMAERAFRFERDDDTTYVAPDNWQFDKAGLLAGERLAIQLQQLEAAYLQKNTRSLEVTQSFSLAQLDPGALLKLRETGSCELSLPELMFDLAYPGQFRRLIRSVRVTMPCLVGPHTNVSAKLALKESKVRKIPTTDPGDLVTLPSQTPAAIATSTAQNDAGMFELSFRDERYLPFEGAGAISTWGLELPSQLRLFDYDTIADVVVHVSYTAQEDGALRDTVQAQIVDALTDYASTVGMHRLFSLRHDFPNAFHLLLHPSGPAQIAELDLGPQHFPHFLAGLDLALAGGSLYLQPHGAEAVDTTGVKIAVNGSNAGSWSTLTQTTLRTAQLSLSGTPLKHWTVKVTSGSLDPAEVRDVLLLVGYTAS